MTSREMLELAASAARFYFNPTVTDGLGLRGCFLYDRTQGMYVWNPEHDQADSDMLGVELEMDVEWNVGYVLVGSEKFGNSEQGEYLYFYIKEPHNGTLDDKARALRLARLKVAAEIGKRMKERQHGTTD